MTSSTGDIAVETDQHVLVEHIADAYAAMDDRRAIKSLIRAGAI